MCLIPGAGLRTRNAASRRDGPGSSARPDYAYRVGVAIELAGAERIDELEELRLVLHDHHAAIAPTLAGTPTRDRPEAWARRRRRYAEWLAEPGAFVLIARREDAAIGFAVVSVEGGYESWDAGERVGAIHDIAVLPAARGEGVGGLLLDRAAAELAATGIGHYRLNVLVGNDDAIRFYERRGLTAVTIQMLGPTG
jgi:ribosomal protein S18 acetylase RimI-like enzyme